MKFQKLLVGAIAMALMCTGCSSSQTTSSSNSRSKPVVTLWAGGSANVRTMWEALIEGFNNNPEYSQKATLELQYLMAGTGEQGLIDRIIAAKKSGQTNTDYDLLDVGGDEYIRYIKEAGEDVFLKLDKEKIPNYDNILAKPAVGEEYLMPYRGTTVVLAYNSNEVPEPPKTADELYTWIKGNPGKFAYNSPSTGGAGGSFVNTALYNFLPEEAFCSDDAKWKEQWDKGFELLAELHPYMYKSGDKVVYPNKNQGTLDLLANKEIAMTPAWADMILSQIDQEIMPEGVKITQIEPAFTGSLLNLAIPSIGSDAEAAHAVIDYMATPEAQSICLNSIFAIPLVDINTLTTDKTELISDLKADNFRITSLGSLGPEVSKAWDEKILILE